MTDVDLDASPRTPSLLRRLASIAYDSLLLCGLLLASALPLPLLPADVRALWWVRTLIQCYLVGVGLLFFVWFWTHGGQTLGMRAWRLRLTGLDGGPVSRRAAWLRGLGALLSWAAAGMGFLWVLIDDGGRAWHDRLSGTRLVLEPKQKTR